MNEDEDNGLVIHESIKSGVVFQLAGAGEASDGAAQNSNARVV